MAELRIDSYVLDVLMRDLAGHDRQPSAFLVYLCLWRRTIGSRVRAAHLSLRQLSESTGLSKSGVQSALRLLARRKLIRIERALPTAVPAYIVLRPWGSKRWRPGVTP